GTHVFPVICCLGPAYGLALSRHPTAAETSLERLVRVDSTIHPRRFVRHVTRLIRPQWGPVMVSPPGYRSSLTHTRPAVIAAFITEGVK
ncbi:MAG TPA: hypothetical protein VEW66_05000, partial [Thermomicrobiales bacterium]|nr:hypothetical protein [Thermomicrobiales bacterium]